VFSTVLVANRGEVAVRITRTLRRLGIRSVAVFSDLDTGSLHARSADVAVRLGPAAPAESYLNVGRIIDAATKTGADAIHPGYGFLSEAPELARACREAGIVFIGPSADAIELMGDKIRAKQTVAAAGVATVPGRAEPGLSDRDLIEAAGAIGFPVLVKPSAGGGGKGMRLVEGPDRIAEQIASARREAASAFGDDTLFIERYLARARHLEVQVLADSHGNVVHLGERECSLQRRHQKIIEEAPSPALDQTLREALGRQAVAVATASSYVNVGTVEFIVSAESPDEAYFMEMNSRLQVEHPVTEMVWGLDLVEQQLRVAAGEPLGFDQEDLHADGHSIEARVYAEDPAHGFLPTGGAILSLHEPPAEMARVDSGVTQGDVVGSVYDPMLAKVIAWAPTRLGALSRLDAALGQYQLLGVVTNVGFLRDLLRLDAVRAGELDTGLVERTAGDFFDASPTSADVAVGAILGLMTSSGSDGVWDLSGWRLGTPVTSSWSADCAGIEHTARIRRNGSAWEVRVDDAIHVIDLGAREAAYDVVIDGAASRYVAARDGRTVWVGREGRTFRFVEPELIRTGAQVHDGAGQITSPMPGVVTSVTVSVGDVVDAGTTLVVVEAMKMEHALCAPMAGHVSAVFVSPSDQVVLGQVVAEIVGIEDVV